MAVASAAKFTQAVLNQTALGIPQVIEASFGSPKYSIDSNGNNVEDSKQIYKTYNTHQYLVIQSMLKLTMSFKILKMTSQI